MTDTLTTFGQVGFEYWSDPHTSCFGWHDPLTGAEIRVSDALDGASAPECEAYAATHFEGV